jgi:transposase-like protein
MKKKAPKKKAKKPAPAAAAPPPLPPSAYPELERGRPSVLTPELSARLAQMVEVCNSIEDAAGTVGLARTTVFNWLQRGREDGRTGRPSLHRDFLDAIERAKAKRRMNFSTRLTLHGQKDWKALAWLAERTDPARFGLRVRVQVHEELERVYDKLKQGLAPEEYERALEALAAPDDSGETPGGNPEAEANPLGDLSR